MLHPAPHLRSVVDADGAVILDINRDIMLSMNSTATYVWQKLTTGMTLDEIVTTLAQESGQDLAIVESDVRDFFDELKVRKMILERPRT